MLLNTENRVLIKHSLELQIHVIENEIENIKQKPETEYVSLIKCIAPFSKNGLTAEKLKESEIKEKLDEIKEIRKLQNMFNDLSNNILVVPKEIKLCLSDSLQ